MKRFRLLLAVPLLVASLSAGGCTEKQTSEQAISPTAQTATDAPKVSLFHYSKQESASLAENTLWDYFELLNKQDLDGVMNLLSDDLRTAYEWQDRMVFRNFKSAKVKRIYDMTRQFPKSPQYVEQHYFYVEADFELNHLYDSNDTDGENDRLGIIVREKSDSPYKIIELSHIPKLKEVDKDAPEAPGTSVNPQQNPSIMVDQQFNK